jgi:hypothetical protein
VLDTCGNFPSRERTFEWTPSTSGSASIFTCGSSFDTVISILEGGCHGVELECNDDGCGLSSDMTVAVAAGQTYTIVVDGFDSGNAGDFTLTVNAP